MSLLALAGPLGVLALVIANTTVTAPPDLTGLAAIITAAIGVFAFLGSIWRGRSNTKRVESAEDAASYVKGFESLVKRLEQEVSELRVDQDRERSAWHEERERLVDTINTLKGELQRSEADVATLRAQLAEMRAQIRAFLDAQSYEQFERTFPPQ